MPPFGTGDRITCGFVVDAFMNRIRVWYKFNGTPIGDAFGDVAFDAGPIYPTIGCDGDCELVVRFGSL